VLRVTADSNIYIYISALQFGGKPLQFLDAARSGAFRLSISNPLMEEILRVLRDKFKWPEEMLEFADARITGFTDRVHPVQILDVVPQDPDDNRVIECAVTAQSHFIVTGDSDLLQLGNYAGIRILKVAEFMELAEWTAS
jgi:putative PIN family toxin of toxin-antitoxin system